MDAKETKSNWAEIRGFTNFMIYRNEFPIEEIVSSTSSQASYTDNNHSDDLLTLGRGEWVECSECTGDTEGKEAGTRTDVVVKWNPILFREKK